MHVASTPLATWVEDDTLLLPAPRTTPLWLPGVEPGSGFSVFGSQVQDHVHCTLRDL